MFDNSYKGKRVLVTGHTGFKGTWLIMWLKILGAKVAGIALDPYTEPSMYNEITRHINYEDDFRCNIKDYENVKKIIYEFKPDFIFHLAAQALVKKSFLNPRDTWESNLLGTVNVLEILRNYDNNCSAVFITSDKCYKNLEINRGYHEEDTLGGDDNYSASKAAAELVISSYQKSFFYSSKNIKIASARAGNVIGGGDWSNDRIVPDCIKSWIKKEKVLLRNPNSTRPWQHVLEPLSGYLHLGSNLFRLNKKVYGESFNFGPGEKNIRTVEDLVKIISRAWKNSNYSNEVDKNEFKEANLLQLDCKKSDTLLKWKPNLNFQQAATFTIDWYLEYYNKKNIYEFSNDQIKKYIDLAKKKNIEWSK
jgi:CDP-glucose 4,6-dehydratase